MHRRPGAPDNHGDRLILASTEVPMPRPVSLLIALTVALATLGLPHSGATFAQVEHDNWPLAEPDWARPGPYRLPMQQDFALESFGPEQRLVGTYFFYWLWAGSY